jgi:hypothetical protein
MHIIGSETVHTVLRTLTCFGIKEPFSGSTTYKGVTSTDTSIWEGTMPSTKAVPLQAWTGPDGSRRVMFPDSKTISTLK